MEEKTLFQKIDEKGSELIVNLIYIVFGAFAIVCSYIFSIFLERR